MTERSLEAQLDDLLGETIDTVKAREQSIIDSLTHPDGGPPVLFGAGALGRITLDGLRRAGVEPRAFADNNQALWGKEVEGVKVLSPAEAARQFGPDVPFVVTIYTHAQASQQLRDLGVRVVPFSNLALRYASTLLPRAGLDLPHKMCGHEAQVREAFSLWADDASRREYLAQVRYRYTLNGPLPPHLPAEATYFPEDIVSFQPDEVFVDCGAYDGDSVRAFLQRCRGQFGGVVALEADPANAARLKASVAEQPEAVRNKIEVVPAAVSSRAGTIRFEATGTAASTFVGGSGSLEVPCVRLDDVLRDRRPSYIKMDIEGAEPDAVAGARAVIQHHAPVLAICLYHDQAHLWQIPLQLRAMTDRYRFFLRRYSDDCWEQVCYAVPADRVRAKS